MGSRGVPEDILEEDEYYDEVGKGKRRRKGKKKKKDQYFVEEITRRDVDMAGAYGGIAKPRIRKVPGGIKLKTINKEKRDTTPNPMTAGMRASSQGKQPGAPMIGNMVDKQYENATVKNAGAEIANNKEAMSQQLQLTQGSGWNSNQNLPQPARSNSKGNTMSEQKGHGGQRNGG
jgi:hypothetical protein